MPAKRMNREEFFAKLVPLDADQLRKVLWNLYWRGSTAVRERTELARAAWLVADLRIPGP